MEKEIKIKLLDNVSEALSVLIGLKKNGRLKAASEKIDETLLKYFDFNAEILFSVSEDFWINKLEEDQGLSPDELSILAEILSEKGDILFAQNYLRDSRKVLEGALKIYQSLNKNQDFFSFKNMNKMLTITEKLSKIDIQIEF